MLHVQEQNRVLYILSLCTNLRNGVSRHAPNTLYGATRVEQHDGASRSRVHTLS